jgi:alcohol dehydrogenase (NADP+)
MPALGFGTWRAERGQTKEAVLSALQAGYRHIDCAAIYGNEKEVGEALSEFLAAAKDVRREDLWVTSKLWNTMHAHVEEALTQTLQDLQLTYLDLYLIHWPIAFAYQGSATKLGAPKDGNGIVQLEKVSLAQTWIDMEKLHDRGLVAHIGVSNWHVMGVSDLLSTARIKPALNQVELHAYFPQTDKVEILKSWGIETTAYCPLGGGFENAPLDDEVVKDLAKKHDRTPAQILIRYCLERGVSVLTKSVNPARIASNLNVTDFALDAGDMEALAKISRGANGSLGILKQFWGMDYHT